MPGRVASVTLSTAFTRMFSLQHPIVLAPMGGSAGGALAAAVSEAGGLGLVGGGRGDPDWVDRELAIVAERTAKPWGASGWPGARRDVRLAQGIIAISNGFSPTQIGFPAVLVAVLIGVTSSDLAFTT